MRISDWSSDVCSSDLADGRPHAETIPFEEQGILPLALSPRGPRRPDYGTPAAIRPACGGPAFRASGQAESGASARYSPDRKRVVEGKSVSVRVDIVGRRTIKKKK